MSNDILMFRLCLRLCLLGIDFVLMLISDEKTLKIMSGIAFIFLAISIIGLLYC